MNPPGLEQIEKTQVLIDRGPLSFALAVFALLLISLFVWNAAEGRRNARALLEVSVAYQTSLNALTAKLEDVLSTRRRPAARKSDPDADTARYRVTQKEGVGDALEQPKGEGAGAGKSREG